MCSRSDPTIPAQHEKAARRRSFGAAGTSDADYLFPGEQYRLYRGRALQKLRLEGFLYWADGQPRILREPYWQGQQRAVH